jgi:hypothetical protein
LGLEARQVELSFLLAEVMKSSHVASHPVKPR